MKIFATRPRHKPKPKLHCLNSVGCLRDSTYGINVCIIVSPSGLSSLIFVQAESSSKDIDIKLMLTESMMLLYITSYYFSDLPLFGVHPKKYPCLINNRTKASCLIFRISSILDRAYPKTMRSR